MPLRDLRLLSVDDDPEALGELRRAVATAGVPISAEYFGSPGKALAAHCARPADIVISDLRLGSTTGLKLIADMQSFAPASVYMLLSGDADLDSALRAMNEARVFRFLTKPATPSGIARAVLDAAAEFGRREAAAISQTGLAAIDRISIAVAILDRDFRVVHSNAAAQAIFRESAVFDIDAQGQLRVRRPADARDFHQFLGQLGKTEENVFRVRRADGISPVVVSALSYLGAPGDEPYYCLFFCDPMRRIFSSEEALAAALDLTPSESRLVLGLADGASLRDAATRAGVSVSTARTYLKNVFSKTGVTRQAELVRLAVLSAA